MKRLSRHFLSIIALLLVIIALLYIFNFEYILKALQVTYFKGYTSAYITDHSEFANREIDAGKTQPWPQHKDYNTVEATPILKNLNEELETVAFLIIKNDSVWYESYAEDYAKDSRTNSFSMAKSIVSALLGKSIQEGSIEGLDQPVADFFPQFDQRLTVGDLSSMSSGLNWDENYYNPFSMTARAYFGEDLREQILSLEVVEAPGKEFKYLSGNTELLGMIIEKATGKPLSEYLSKSFWKPMGMQQDALWQLDSEENGMEKAYCCIASNARDFARFGKLYKDHGNWNGKQLLDSAFVATSIKPRFETAPFYGYGLWLEHYRDKEIFYMRGILGQYVIVIPEDDIIIVRLGNEKYRIKEDQKHSDDFYMYIDETYQMLKEKS